MAEIDLQYMETKQRVRVENTTGPTFSAAFYKSVRQDTAPPILIVPFALILCPHRQNVFLLRP